MEYNRRTRLSPPCLHSYPSRSKWYQVTLPMPNEIGTRCPAQLWHTVECNRTLGKSMHYRGISWTIVEYNEGHGISWNRTQDCAVPWKNEEYRGISWNNIEYHGILWIMVNVIEERRTSWHIVGYHGISLKHVEYYVRTCNIAEYHGRTYNIMEYYGIL